MNYHLGDLSGRHPGEYSNRGDRTSRYQGEYRSRRELEDGTSTGTSRLIPGEYRGRQDGDYSERRASPDYSSRRGSDFLQRPASEQLVDLHIYVVPMDLWREHLHSAISQIISDTISAGFIRVHPESRLVSIREEIASQLGYDYVPRQYVFLRNVGRCLTQVRTKQEHELKAKVFTPPQSYTPDLFVLDASAASRTSTSSSYDYPDLYTYRRPIPSISIATQTGEDTSEQDRLRLEELLRRKREEEERRRREEEERRRREEEERRLREEEERRRRMKEIEWEDWEAEKARILRELKRLRDRRDEIDRLKEEYHRRLKNLQAKSYSHKNMGRDVWKKKYFEEKKRSPPKEEECNKRRQELEEKHRKILGNFETIKDGYKKIPEQERMLEKVNLKIESTRQEHDIEELHTRLQNIKMKLTAEMRLRNQAENELRGLKNELNQKTANMEHKRALAYNEATGGGASEPATARVIPAFLTPRQRWRVALLAAAAEGRRR